MGCACRYALNLVTESGNPVGVVIGAEGLHRRPATCLDESPQVLIVAIGDNLTVTGHHSQQLMELPMNSIHVFVDIRVIKLEVVEYQRPRPVMNELRPLVEECGVVLVRLNNEIPGFPEPGRRSKIGRDTANQEAGLKAGIFQNPGQHGGRRRLAMCTSNREDVSVMENIFSEPLWS